MAKNQRLWDNSFLNSEEYLPVQRVLDMPYGQRALLCLGSNSHLGEIERPHTYRQDMIEILPEDKRKNYEFTTPKTLEGFTALIVKKVKTKKG